MLKHDLTHARHDSIHCLAPGLFRSLQKGERKKTKLDIRYTYGDGDSARFIGFEPLGADDLRLLQGLAALGGPTGLVLDSEPSTYAGKHLRLCLEPRLGAEHQNALMCRSSMSGLLAEIGLTDGTANILAMRESLCRMANVTVIVQQGRREASFKLLSYGYDDETGELLVGLNPRIAAAILGDRHVRIEMGEVRALASDPARLIHQRLCGWIDQGVTRTVEIDTLSEYVWPDETESANTRKKRLATVRKSLAELVNIGWLVEEYAPRKFKITRPVSPVVTVPASRSNGTRLP